jgi:hypothetical protein
MFVDNHALGECRRAEMGQPSMMQERDPGSSIRQLMRESKGACACDALHQPAIRDLKPR